jgi:hypothetical protein
MSDAKKKKAWHCASIPLQISSWRVKIGGEKNGWLILILERMVTVRRCEELVAEWGGSNGRG